MGEDREPLASADRISAEWLSLREAADAAAREPTRPEVAALLAELRPTTVVDVGCGTGAGGRWLLPLLSGDPGWLLLDHDPDLLADTAERLAARGATGPVETREADVADLDAALDGAAGHTLTIASALLDLLTPSQVQELVHTCIRRGAPLLVALTVTGRMTADPGHPEDGLVTEAFNRHQRRGGRCGPDAVAVLTEAARGQGTPVRTWETPWRLGPDDAVLLRQLVEDRAAVAAEQLDAEGTAPADGAERARRWRDDRLGQLAAGRLHLEIGHQDVLVGRAGLEPATKRL
ncbi:methyltransferase domain-containing protein [Nesterenkonia sp. CL21]|uniref:methyltransferase domain-containing protein n=1 Tax=unclassified Nesterenkonia TaxID=2629769 RepID=UPI0037C810EC